MENTTTEKTKCLNCKYYQEHYVLCGTRYYPLFDGHCMNDIWIKSTRKNKYQLRENCEYWESNKSVKREKVQTVKDTLKNMKTQLNSIRNILENLALLEENIEE